MQCKKSAAVILSLVLAMGCQVRIGLPPLPPESRDVKPQEAGIGYGELVGAEGKKVFIVNYTTRRRLVTVKVTSREGFATKDFTTEYTLLAGEKREVGTTGGASAREFQITGISP